MASRWIVAGAVNGLVAVAAGAYAAHGLQMTAGAEPASWMETGSRYQMWHALALLAVALLGRNGIAGWLAAAAWGFAIGIVLFSGSLYLMALADLRAVAWVTPVGGLALLAGWGALAVHGWRR